MIRFTMLSVFPETLPQAFGVAVSPVPIAAIILVLMSRNGFPKSVAFVAGWFLGLLVMIGLIIRFIHHIENSGQNEDGVAAPVIKIIFGLILLVMSFRSWQKRPAKGVEPDTPKWMASLDRFGKYRTMILGALLGTFNLKNLPITISAAGIFASHHITAAKIFPSVAAFCLVGSLGVAVPVIVARSAGERAEAVLHRWKVWLSKHNAVIMFVLFLVIGLAALSGGISDLYFIRNGSD
ncbi:MAG: GAP family protein [Verrucomicrobiales bacterium]|nr:GAP family protein [Verrucomicrobiales bacterium]